jgi:hypothetical protein
MTTICENANTMQLREQTMSCEGVTDTQWVEEEFSLDLADTFVGKHFLFYV